MPKFRFLGSTFLATIRCAAISCILHGGFAHGQQTYKPNEVRVSGLPALAARSHDASDVLLTSLDTIIHDREVCCGKDSALEDSAQRADPASPQDIAAKLQGRHLLSDGRPITVTATYIAPDALYGYLLIETLRQKHAMLLFWKSHLYVLNGATYVESFDPNTGIPLDSIATLLLIDARYSDSRRTTEFNRETDDWSKVRGVLWVSVEGP